MSGSFTKAVVAQFEARRASELESLIRRHGGEPWAAPALSEVAIEVGAAERGVIDRLAAQDFDIVVLLTGTATRRLLEEASRARVLPETKLALEKATTVARGPKPVFELKKYGLRATHLAPEPNTTSDLIGTLAGLPVAGQRVLILSAGEQFAEPMTTLRARGAHPVELQLYRWALSATDALRLERTIHEILARRVHVVVFTTQVQVRHLFDVAARAGQTDWLANALRDHVLVGAVGPTCAAALRERGIEPDVVPEHPKMGHLVVALAREIERRRSAAADRTMSTHVSDYVGALHDRPGVST